jgi:hypothetical protein
MLWSKVFETTSHFFFCFFSLCTEAQGCVGCWEAGVWGHCDASPRCPWVSAWWSGVSVCVWSGVSVCVCGRVLVCVCVCVCVCVSGLCAYVCAYVSSCVPRSVVCLVCLVSLFSRFLLLSVTAGIWCALKNKKRSFLFISLQNPQRFEFVVTEV